MADMQPQGEMTPDRSGGPGHEANEIKVKGIVLFAIGLVALGVMIHAALVLVIESFQSHAAQDRAARPPFFTLDVVPPGPRLQGNPAVDLARLRERALNQLTNYGWLDRERGIAHIPIDRAMDILARSGLPRVTRPKAASSGPEAEIELRLTPRPRAAAPADSGGTP